MDLTESDIESRITRADAAMAEAMTQFERSRDALFRGHDEFTRLLVGLSSGALVLSVSVVQLLHSLPSLADSGFFLAASWLFFAVATVAGCWRQWHAGPSRTITLTWQMKKAELEKDTRAAIAASTPDTLNENLDKAARPFFEKVTAAPNGAFRTYERAGLWMFYSFCAGLVCLMVFAICELWSVWALSNQRL